MSEAAPAALARRVQPLWAAVPVTARAAVLRRAAQAVLDEVETLAGLLAAQTGRPRTGLLLGELLPSVSGLHALAAAAPTALRERRTGRHGRLIPAPFGVVGLRGGGAASPWAEPLLETAAAVVTGNAVLVAPAPAADRLAAVFARAGAPEELVAVVDDPSALGAACDAVHDLDAVGPRSSRRLMLVLDGASAGDVVAAALPAFAGLVVAPRGTAGLLAAELATAAGRLRLGSPLDAATEVGPLSGPEVVAEVEALVAAAEAAGAERLCGGPVEVPGLTGAAFFAPAVLRGGPQLLADPPPGPVVSVVAADGDAAAIALADTGAAISIWTGERARGERIARRLRAERTWVNEPGDATVAPPVRLVRHLRVRSIRSGGSRLRLQPGPEAAAASLALARLAHGRESERWAALRSGAAPLARAAGRLARSLSARR